MNSNSISTLKYNAYFCLLYLAIAVLVVILEIATGIELKSSAIGFALIASTYGVMMMFVKDHKRAPDNTEKAKLIGGAMVGSVAVLLVSLAGYYFSQDSVTQIVLGKLLTEHVVFCMSMAAFILLLHFTAFFLIFGWSAKLYAGKFAENE